MSSDREAAGAGRPFTAADLDACLKVLEAFVDDRALLAGVSAEDRRRLLLAAGRVSRPERAEQRELARAFRKSDRRAQRSADTAILDAAGIRVARREPVFRTPDAPALSPSTAVAPVAPAVDPAAAPAVDPAAPAIDPADEPAPPSDAGAPELARPRKCYVCKAEFRKVHFFYDSMCTPCGDFNYTKRSQTAPLDGRVALVTGARVKIGYQAAIMLLRAGARVIVTTRFPHDAARRFSAERDFDVWGARLSIYGLDLRHTPSVELFTRHLLRTLDRLDFVLNNACQTVRRPPGFYSHLIEGETAPVRALPGSAQPLLRDYDVLRERGTLPLVAGGDPSAGIREPALLSQIPGPGDEPLDEVLFPRGRYDADLQQVDLRSMNSWRLTLAEVPTVELLEVQLVNAVAPFVLNSRLKPLMLRQPTFDRHIVNVSAMEGQFYRRYKTDRHPHTNMAKAALNMMTRTSAPDYAKDGIFMNSVDTGWVTDEDPAALAARKLEEHGFHPPLDIVDGAARICDPIFSGLLTGQHRYGQFLKDYMPADW
ncbi:oxidoreductase [Sorangium cellulosum]|uniref:Oxidoreductase n=1 Tax=Sorangium cellulosum TaxID=56 RepID=A0A2L0EQ46_SORCE|nr:SDR family oxidoreductase [Sorangium cellulosum]AUX41428.1 oxidoreductase [Sorangium cellulosum]